MRRANDRAVWVDDRLAGEPKAPGQKATRQGASHWPTRFFQAAAVIAACYIIGVHELVFAAFTSVHCTPSMVQAGRNVSCSISMGRFGSEADLSITQVGVAGQITLVDESSHSYRIAFGTRKAGDAGVRVTHSMFWSTSWVEVVAAPAVSIDVKCGPPRVALGTAVNCAVTPRDRFGNEGEVERPPGSESSYFSVYATGCARELVVHDAHVSLFAGDAASGSTACTRAGVSVILDGSTVSSAVDVGGFGAG